MVRRVMVASYMHGCVEAFYARRVGEGNQILQMKSFKSVEMIHGHPSVRMRLGIFAKDAAVPLLH
jgi:hypothetical protein